MMGKIFRAAIVCITMGICSSFTQDVSAEYYLTVTKRGVTYNYIHTDAMVDDWVVRVFPSWEEETFDVFEWVQDPNVIAIDIGAWIGPTAIWLSHHFFHVVAVEPDKVSLDCLEKNLAASGCDNVTICPYPVTHDTHPVIFGPREDREPELNRSMSYVKDTPSSGFDYQIDSITLSQMVSEYILSDATLSNYRIGFIKCDIEGGEEDILEDILTFALQSKCSVYLSFHYSWWKKQNIYAYSSLFARFNVSCSGTDVATYISQNPFGSVLFTAK